MVGKSYHIFICFSLDSLATLADNTGNDNPTRGANMTQQWLSSSQLARLTGYSQRTIIRMADEGRIPKTLLWRTERGGWRRFHPDAVDWILKQREGR